MVNLLFVLIITVLMSVVDPGFPVCVCVGGGEERRALMPLWAVDLLVRLGMRCIVCIGRALLGSTNVHIP